MVPYGISQNTFDNNPPTCHDIARMHKSGYWGYASESAENIPFADIVTACVTETGTAKPVVRIKDVAIATQPPTQPPVTYSATGEFYI